jgi:glutamate--cysteine ligase
MPSKVKVLEPHQIRQAVHHSFFPENSADHQTIGLELEVWPFRTTLNDRAEILPHYNEAGSGLIQLLKEFEQVIPELRYTGDDEMPKFAMGEGNLTFEPGGQWEYSGPPFNNLEAAIADINNVIEKLRCMFKAHNVWFFHSGMNPWHSVSNTPMQLKKERYRSMNNYFEAIGPYGQQMMRLSTSLQVNLDVGTPETAQRRWLAANLMAPIFTATFANSPFAAGQPTGFYSFRANIWQHLDKTRTGFPKDLLSDEYKPCPVSQYLDFALDAYVFKLPLENGEQRFHNKFRTFRSWYEEGHNGWYPTLEDWVDHLTTLFPEVRPKGFFELRSMDAQSRVWCSVPGILMTNILYDAEACEKIIEWMTPYRTTLPGMLEVAAEKSLEESVLADLAVRTFELGLSAHPSQQSDRVIALAERFFNSYTSLKQTPAHSLLKLNDGKLFTPDQYRSFERTQVEAAADVLQVICEYT